MADQFQRINLVINGKEVANEIGSILKAKRELNKEINKMVVGSEEYVKATSEMKNLNTTIAQHSQAIRGAGSASEQLRSTMTGVGAAAIAAFSVEAVIGFGKEIFKSAVQLDTLQRKAQTVFGGSISIVEQFADSMSQSLGQSRSETIAAATSIGDLLIPMGFARDTSAVLSTQLVGLSGALSEWTGGQRTATEVSTILTKALLGERDELKSLGIAISEEDVKTRLAAEGKDKLTGKALEQAKAMATLSLVMAKSQDAQTAFAQNSDSLVRSQARLESALATIKESLANAFIPFFSKAAGAVADMLAPSTKMVDTLKEQKSHFNFLITAVTDSNISMDKRRELIGEINSKYKEYLPFQISEKTNLQDIKKAQDAVNAGMLAEIQLQGALMNVSEKRMETAAAAKKRDSDLLEKNRREQQMKDDRERQKAGEKVPLKATMSMGEALYGVLSGGKNALDEKIKDDTSDLDKGLKELDEMVAFYTKQYGDKFTAAYSKTLNPGETPVNPKVDPKDPDRKSKLEKALKDLEEIYQKHYQDLQQLQVSDYEKGRVAIEQKYQNDIDKANENLKSFEGTAKERSILEAKTRDEILNINILKDEELTIYSRTQGEKARKELEEEALKKMETEAKLQADDLAASKKFMEDKDKERKDFQKTLDDKLSLSPDATDPFAKYQTELDALKVFYDESVLIAEELGIDVTSITQKYQDKKGEIIKAGEEAVAKDIQANAEKRAKEFNAEIDALSSAFQGFGQVFTAMSDLIGEEGEKSASFQKALTLFQIAIDTASAISSLTKHSSANPANAVTFGAAGIAQFATGIAQIITNIAKAKQLLSNDGPKRQKFMGGFEPVIGAVDGQSYNAQRITQTRTGLLNYNNPVLTPSGVLANERGMEYFVSAQDVSNPFVMKSIQEIEAYKYGGTRQFADGGFNNTSQSASDDKWILLYNEIKAMRSDIKMMQAVIAWTDSDTIEFRKRYNDLQDVSGGKYPLNS
jgi:hypothetical protein